MSLALKRIFPEIYKKIKSIHNKFPASVEFWDKKQYRATNKIKELFEPWKRIEPLIKESNIAFESYNGGDFIDVGSYIGFYSFLLAPKSKPSDVFISCEPDKSIQSDLLENLKILSKLFQNLKIDFVGSPINKGNEVSLVHTPFGHPSFQEIINTNSNKNLFKSKTVDSIVDSFSLSPKFVKIDVEGAELDVLKGMKLTLEKYKPKIMLEKHPTLIPKNINLKNIDEYLLKYNYQSKLIHSEDIAIREMWY
jgi:FkbM family methyltransferase